MPDINLIPQPNPGIRDYLDPLRHQLIHKNPTTDPGFQIGMIVLWYGDAANVPNGWAICNGANGTPNLRGRVPVGLDEADAVFDTLGEMGGSKTSTATHTHDLSSHTHSDTTGGPSTGSTGTVSSWHTHSGNTGFFSANHTHGFTTGADDRNHHHTVSVRWGGSTNHHHSGQPNWLSEGINPASGSVNVATTGHNTGHLHSGTTGTVSANHSHAFSTGNPSANHSHSMQNHTHAVTTGGPSNNTSGGSSAGASNGNLQPYLALHFIMRV